MAQHSVIGASGYYRWSECPGSVNLCKDLPPKTTVYTEEGTLAHEVGERIIRGELTWDDASVLYLPEMLEAVKVYTELILDEFQVASECGIEIPFDMSDLHPGLFGTTDAFAYVEETFTLKVFDYKHGRGHFIKVEHNPQLMYYALGALLKLGKRVDTIELVICQPRCPRGGEVIHRWKFPALEIFDFMVDLVVAAKRTAEPTAPLKTGAWCFFCGAVSFCPAQAKERSDKAIEEFPPLEGEETVV